MSTPTPDQLHNQLVDNFVNAGQAQVDAVHQLPDREDLLGEMDFEEVIGGKVLQGYLGGSVVAPEISYQAADGDKYSIVAKVTMPDSQGATRYTTDIRNYDYAGIPRHRTWIETINEDGSVESRIDSTDPKTAYSASRIASRAIVRGFNNPKSEKSRLDRIPEATQK